MAFSQATITDGPNYFITDSAELRVSWSSSSPEGTEFQLYENGHLVWHGTDREAFFAIQPVRQWFDVGTVGDGEEQTDFSASLPAIPGSGDRARLTWQGGTYEAADIAGFHVYSGTAPSGAISHVAPVATVPAYLQGIITDGFGMGGFGLGGFGESSADYAWISEPLAPGTWNFGVKAFDAAGNESTEQTFAVVIAAPPLPPAPFSDGLRLHYNFETGFGTGGFGMGGFGTATLELDWNASP